jgi:hypothetical protein
MREKNDSSTRRFWVVSPNVANDYRTVKQWKKAIIHYGAAFMGYPPNNKTKRIGYRFAHSVKNGDIVLIARRKHHQPDIVGFGIVRGKLRTHIHNFKPPGGKKFGSMRKLSPFVVREHLPQSLNVMSVLGQTAALRHVRRSTHEKICRWLERELRIKRATARYRSKSFKSQPNAATESTKAILAKLPQDHQFDYKQRTIEAVRHAKKVEAKLLKDYCDWLNAKGKNLQTITDGRLRCDGYESERGNLIEAKSKVEREYIRMAVGQLFDYAFLGREERARPNLAILLPAKPAQREIEWLKPLKISVIWRQKDKFKDNAGNRFC